MRELYKYDAEVEIITLKEVENRWNRHTMCYRNNKMFAGRCFSCAFAYNTLLTTKMLTRVDMSERVNAKIPGYTPPKLIRNIWKAGGTFHDAVAMIPDYCDEYKLVFGRIQIVLPVGFDKTVDMFERKNQPDMVTPLSKSKYSLLLTDKGYISVPPYFLTDNILYVYSRVPYIFDPLLKPSCPLCGPKGQHLSFYFLLQLPPELDCGCVFRCVPREFIDRRVQFQFELVATTHRIEIVANILQINANAFACYAVTQGVNLYEVHRLAPDRFLGVCYSLAWRMKNKIDYDYKQLRAMFESLMCGDMLDKFSPVGLTETC